MLIDSHCHLDLLPPDSIATVLDDAARLGVEKIIIPGLDPTQWQAIQLLAETYSSVFFAVGLHPWWIEKQLAPSENIVSTLNEKIPTFLQHPKCVAIGECGLDQFISTQMDTQISVLQAHLQLAEKLKMPVILHSRKTHHLLLQQLKITWHQSQQHRSKIKNAPPRGVIHAFSGHVDQAQAFLKQGLLLGIGGTITYERAKKSRRTVQLLSLDSMILETDSPDMPLFGFQGVPNTPSQVFKVSECLASLRQESINTIQKATTTNALSLFNL